MKNLIFFICVSFSVNNYGQYTARVNNFLGSEFGNVFPGAQLPFGMIKLGPDVVSPQPTSGYSFDKPVLGFSHTHLSGTGGGARYGNILVIPQVGSLTRTDAVSLKRTNETAFPGYYSVVLSRKQGDVRCDLTCGNRVGFHKYEFFTWGADSLIDASILIDIGHTNTRGKSNDSRCTGGLVSITGQGNVEGFGHYAGGWGGQNPYTVYFSAAFSKPFTSFGMYTDTLFSAGDSLQEGKNIGAYLRFRILNHSVVMMKVAISFVSIEQARKNLNEIAHWDFDRVRASADSIWNSYLGRIRVFGGTAEQQVIFYSSLRNTMIMPTDVTGENPRWQSTEPHYWDHYCLWDVFRSVMPLHTLIIPQHQSGVIRSLLDIYKHAGWLPDAWIAGDYSDIQGGTNADVVITDAIVKKLPGIDLQRALEAMKKNAEVQSDNPKLCGRYVLDYNTYGYVLPGTTDGVISRTLEYAYNDYCIAQVAKQANDMPGYNKYVRRAGMVLDLFNSEYGYFWAKDKDGNWLADFSLDSKRSDSWNDPYFYEGGTMTYSYYVPHDMQGLINRHGSKEKFIRSLDFLFTSGRFKLSNEPLFLVPYSYNYAARQDKTAVVVRKLMAEQYSASRRGLPGQDDSGALSSWYVFSAMGFFPVAGQDVYLIGSPLFDKIEMDCGNGKTFSVIAKNNSSSNLYIQSAKLNGNEYKRSWITHSDIVSGSVLELTMGSSPSGWGTNELPPSLSAPAIK